MIARASTGPTPSLPAVRQTSDRVIGTSRNCRSTQAGRSSVRANLVQLFWIGDVRIMALRIAGAAGYLEAGVVSAEVGRIDRVVGGLYKLAYRR